MTDPLTRLTAALSDRYRLERELGAGGMATVYLAQDLRHDRQVAIKVLRPELAAVVGAERFLSEIRTTANLQHPHILPLFDSGEADTYLFFVMPYVEGESLRDRLDREKQLPVDDAVRIAKQVADALAHAHGRGVIHRDIKPANILLRDGNVQVADFGIALAVSAAGGTRLTETGLSVGTPAYMSPEQATGDRPLDGRTDVYSLGCVLYEMLAGDPPHVASTAQAVLGKILTEEPRPLSEVRRSVPLHVEGAVQAALEKLPADRIPSASEFAQALSGGRTLEGWSRAGTKTSLSGLFTTALRSPRTRVRLAAWGFAAVAALVGVTAWATLRLAAVPASGGPDARPFTFSFTLQGPEQVAVDMDQLLLDVSADGEVIAWIGATGDGPRRVYYRSVRDVEVKAVPGTEGVQNIWLDLSPDGREVSFRRDGEDDLWTAPLDGGRAPQKVYAGAIWSWAWAEDDSFVLAQAYGGLLRLAEPGAEPETLTRLEADEVTHQYPQVLPGGAVLFSVGVGHFHATRVEVAYRDGDTMRRKVLVDDAYSASYVDPGYLVFGRGDQILAVPFDPERLAVTGPEVTLATGVQTDFWGPVTEYAVSRNGTLVRVPEQGLADWGLARVEEGNGIEWLDMTPSPWSQPRVSPDGRSVAVATRLQGDRRRQIYVLDLNRLVARRVTDGALHDKVVWSADGRELLFNSTRDGHLNLYRAPATTTTEAVRVTTSNFDQSPQSWGGVGRLLLVERLPHDSSRVLMLSQAEQSEEPVPITPVVYLWTPAALSPDGGWFAYVVDGQVLLRRVDSGGTGTVSEDQVSRAGGNMPRWAPDGRRLYYLSRDNRRILAVDVDLAGGPRLGREVEAFVAPDDVELNQEGAFDVGPDGRLLVVARRKKTAPMEVVVTLNRIGS